MQPNKKTGLLDIRFLQYLLYFSCFALFFTNVFIHSWIEEDAFISFRVVDNFVHGFGLRWNIFERVQTYTNPLWLLLHIPLYAYTGNIALTTFTLSWWCLIGTVLVVWRTFDFSPLRHTVLFILPLLLSPTETLYFTSGLETPLLSFLMACFGYVLIRRPAMHWFWLGFVTSLSLVCRLDTVIFYAPVWIVLLCLHRWCLPWKQLIASTFPLVAWEAFSLFYYGFLLPNTALAKLEADIPLLEYIYSGVAYTYDFILADPYSFILIGVACLYPFSLLFRSYGLYARDEMQKIAGGVALGITAYCLYIIYIGGYQLSLRMYSLPVIAAYWFALWRFPSVPTQVYVYVAACAVFIQSAWSVSPEERSRQSVLIKTAGISPIPMQRTLMGRAYYFHDYWINWDWLVEKPGIQKQGISFNNCIGMQGFYSGPLYNIIDGLGLGDPLMARLPADKPMLPLVGHINRTIPDGYVTAVTTGSTKEMDAGLGQYYDKLQLITQGPLWYMPRLITIIRFNLGQYDYLKNEYVRTHYPMRDTGEK